MKKLSVIIAISVFAVFLRVQPAHAQYTVSCLNIYGANCPTGSLFLNKQVKNPQTGEFVDSLSSNGPNFLPGQEVDFRIIVQNNGSSELDNISVSDQFPSYLNFSSGPGNFDTNSKILTWNIASLPQGATQSFDIRTTLDNSDVFPDLGITCLTNSSQATVSNQVAKDTAVFCVQTKILGTAKTLPETGPKETALILFASLGSLLISLTLFTKKLKRGGEFIER